MKHATVLAISSIMGLCSQLTWWVDVTDLICWQILKLTLITKLHYIVGCMQTVVVLIVVNIIYQDHIADGSPSWRMSVGCIYRYVVLCIRTICLRHDDAIVQAGDRVGGWRLSSGCLEPPQATSGHLPQTAQDNVPEKCGLSKRISLWWTWHYLRDTFCKPHKMLIQGF